MYESPISLCISELQTQVVKQQDEQIYQAVVSVGVNVDKAELLRALRYDRQQYEKGYADAMAGMQRWIPVRERLPEKEERVLTVTESGYVQINCITNRTGGWFMDMFGSSEKPTHWMPLPEPPKGE